MVRKEDIDSSALVLYTCPYVPQEIIMAVGFNPKRFVPESRPSGADGFVHPNTCHYIKSLLASGLAGEVSSSAALIIANSCDGMRRFYDIWEEYVRDVPALFIDVPKKSDPGSVEFYASELRSLSDKLEKIRGRPKLTRERLSDAINVCNDVRVQMNKVFAHQRDAGSEIKGTSVFQLCMEGLSVSLPKFAERLKEFHSGLKRGNGSDGEKRFVLTGNMISRPDLISLIENSGARVVALDTCTGMRQYDTLVEENAGDPMQALAARYLRRASCARMEGTKGRSERLRGLVADSRAHGVILSTVKFCDTFIYDAPWIQRSLQETGIPCLLLENDYEWSGLEQMKTRVEAFVAMVSEREAS